MKPSLESRKGASRKRAYHHKNAVFSLVERDDEVRSFHVDKANAENVLPSFATISPRKPG